MTVAAATRKAGPFTGDGVNVSFPFTFKVFQASDVLVVQTDTSGNETTQTLTSQYTVALNSNQDSNPGGTVTMLAAPAVGYSLTLGSQVPYSQLTVLTNTGGFFPTVINDMLDKVTALVQQLSEKLSRALSLPFSAPAGVSLTLPLPAANKIISWNATANGLQNIDPATLASVVAYGTANADIFTGTGAQTVFALSANPGTQANLGVTIGGVTQLPGIDYTWSGGTSLVFAAAPPNGAKVLARYMRGLPQGTADAGAVTYSDGGSYGTGTVGYRLVQLLSSIGSSLVGFIQAGVGAVTRFVQDKLRERVSVKDFGAKGDGVTNDTAAIQAALTYCYSVNKDLFLPSGNYLISAQLLNKGVSMIGEGRLYSQILLATSFPAATSIILVQPDNGAYIDFLELGRFSVQPTNGGTKYGGTAIFMNFQQTTNLSKLHMHDLYLLPGNDYSFQVNNNMAVNFQGVPANSTIERCYFAEGSKLIGIGDSNMIHENIFRASGGNRTAIWLYMSDTSGVASHTVIRENNIDCPGGALYAIKGRSIKFIYNNVELSAGSGTPNGSIVDIDGSSGSIPWAEVDSNHIGIFGTATGTSAVRVNGAQGCSVDKNTILSGLTVASGILITASAGDTDIGFNEIQSTYTTPINNSGLRTMGVPLAQAFLNSFTNTGGGYQPLTAYKSRTGLVTLAGVVNAPATPSGLIISTLPLGYRPATIQRFAASTVSGGAIVGYAVEVDTAGNVVCYCNTNTTRIEINATFPTLNYVSGSL